MPVSSMEWNGQNGNCRGGGQQPHFGQGFIQEGGFDDAAEGFGALARSGVPNPRFRITTVF